MVENEGWNDPNHITMDDSKDREYRLRKQMVKHTYEIMVIRESGHTSYTDVLNYEWIDGRLTLFKENTVSIIPNMKSVHEILIEIKEESYSDDEIWKSIHAGVSLKRGRFD